MAHHVHTMDALKRKYPTATLIKNWEELKVIPNESKSHILEVGDYNGWLRAKNPRPYSKRKSYARQIPYQDHYLSTHTFYGLKYISSTELMQQCGFNVIIDNWDA